MKLTKFLLGFILLYLPVFEHLLDLRKMFYIFLLIKYIIYTYTHKYNEGVSNIKIDIVNRKKSPQYKAVLTKIKLGINLNSF